MWPSVVVEADPVSDDAGRVLEAFKAVAVDTLFLQRTDDALDHAVRSRPPEWWKLGRPSGVPAQAARGVSICDAAGGARANRSISSSTVSTLANASIDR